MSFIGGYESSFNLSALQLVGNIPVENSLGGYGVATGVNNFLLALTPPITQYKPGLPLEVKFVSSNSAPATLNVDGKGAKNIKKIVAGVLTDLATGDIEVGKVYLLIYDGTVFQVANPTAVGGGPAPAGASEAQAGIAQIATTADTNAGTNDSKIVTPAKLAAFVAGKITGLWNDKGLLDCSTNPPYPAGIKGDAYTIIVPGRIGGPGGQVVEIRDVLYCFADNAGGSSPILGESWNVIQGNLIQATELLSGFAKIATQSQVNTGTDDTRFVTPLKLKTVINTTIKPVRSQIRFYSDSLFESETNPSGTGSPNFGAITVVGIPAGAIIRQATLIWQATLRNTAGVENWFTDGHVNFGSGSSADFLPIPTLIRLDAHQMTFFSIVVADVTSKIIGNAIYVAVINGMTSAASSLFMGGYWTLEIDYEAPIL